MLYEGGTKDMKPRVFVSSTFYDLKYIREDLSNFIRTHDFEPIMFEDGDIGYTPGKPLDKSCYETMKSSDMVILVIGGLYGSPATSEEKDEFKEYMSVTRNEFRTAVNEGIPVFVFIDTKVFSEYAVYEMNEESIEEQKVAIKFSATKDINIFRFIREIKGIGNIVVIEFSKLVQIKDFLSKQWSDMFRKYLDILKEQKADKKLENAVDEMKSLINRMDTMLDGIGKKVLGESENVKYSDIVEEIEIARICDALSENLMVEEFNRGDKKENIKRYLEGLIDFVNEIPSVEEKRDKQAYLTSIHQLYADQMMRRGSRWCKSNDSLMQDLGILRSLKVKEVYQKVRTKLLEDKYYKKIFETF